MHRKLPLRVVVRRVVGLIVVVVVVVGLGVVDVDVVGILISVFKQTKKK